ncbi:MAG: PDZ domain-containing protein [Phycisphaerales bacterium]
MRRHRVVLEKNHDTVRIMDEAVLHEFGNGAMTVLDDYTAIIWPDELNRFRRSTQRQFIGVGIQIQLDELQNIKVVTPLEGTPAQQAGVRADDIIKKVNGLSAVGLGLDQAVEGHHQAVGHFGDAHRGAGQGNRRDAGARVHPRPQAHRPAQRQGVAQERARRLRLGLVRRPRRRHRVRALTGSPGTPRVASTGPSQ